MVKNVSLGGIKIFKLDPLPHSVPVLPKLSPVSISPDREILVRSRETIQHMIEMGSYESVSKKIDSFDIGPIALDYQAKVVVVRFNQDIPLEVAAEEMQSLKLRHASTAECLSYGVSMSRARKMFDLEYSVYRLICPGSTAVINEQFHVLVLGRRLTSVPWNSICSTDDRFLAVRED